MNLEFELYLLYYDSAVIISSSFLGVVLIYGTENDFDQMEFVWRVLIVSV